MTATTIRPKPGLAFLIGKILACVVLQSSDAPQGAPLHLAEKYDTVKRLLREAALLMDGIEQVQNVRAGRHPFQRRRKAPKVPS